MPVFDFKKAQKVLYTPKTTPSVVEVPEMLFLMADGKGDPNTSREFSEAIELLYGLSYTVRMNKTEIGFFEYVVPPLEGLWEHQSDFSGKGAIPDKGLFLWTLLVRQPEFVTTTVFEKAKDTLKKKKPQLDVSRARIETFTEGLCVQAMHIGPYDDEPATIARMEAFVIESDYEYDISADRRHHEIYLSDPRKSSPEKMKTVVRHPVKRRCTETENTR